jgi:hypothetical protein
LNIAELSLIALRAEDHHFGQLAVLTAALIGLAVLELVGVLG